MQPEALPLLCSCTCAAADPGALHRSLIPGYSPSCLNPAGTKSVLQLTCCWWHRYCLAQTDLLPCRPQAVECCCMSQGTCKWSRCYCCCSQSSHAWPSDPSNRVPTQPSGDQTHDGRACKISDMLQDQPQDCHEPLSDGARSLQLDPKGTSVTGCQDLRLTFRISHIFFHHLF